MLLEVLLQAEHLLFNTAALQIIISDEGEGKMVLSDFSTTTENRRESV